MKNDNGYLGDKAWQDFAKLYGAKWLEFDRKDAVLDLVGQDELLAMVVSQVSLDPESWLSTKIPALKGKTPLWCIKNGREKQLKAMLMSMPR